MHYPSYAINPQESLPQLSWETAKSESIIPMPVVKTSSFRTATVRSSSFPFLCPKAEEIFSEFLLMITVMPKQFFLGSRIWRTTLLFSGDKFTKVWEGLDLEYRNTQASLVWWCRLCFAHRNLARKGLSPERWNPGLTPLHKLLANRAMCSGDGGQGRRLRDGGGPNFHKGSAEASRDFGNAVG